jgi:cell division protein ZipA
MSIFHRRNSGETLFSVANLVVPGTFDPSTMDGFSSPGLALFVTLPGPADPVAAFEAMYECAQQMASRLDADLCDARRKPLDATALAALRDEAGRAAGT